MLFAGMAFRGVPVQAQHSSQGQDFARIERGRYLTYAADCAACHDDPYQKRAFAGGRPIETPFGVVVAPNITPDRATGIGSFTDAQFEDALRHGRQPDGKHLYPAMPFVYYTKMSHDDVLAIRAYLNTIQAVHHEVVSDQLPFPFSIRMSMSLWNGLYFAPGVFKPDPSKSAAWNRGAFLVQGPGHCAACHTPKSVLGGDKTSDELEGYSIQGWFAPNLTSGANTGLTDWKPEDIVEYLKKGHNRFAAASGPMAEEIADSSSYLSDVDLEAIATYLKDQHSEQPARIPVSANDPTMIAGAAIYQDLCSACHKSNGTGVPYLIPDLAASTSVAARDPTTLIRVILEGAQSVATKEEPTAPAMPAFGWQLDDAEIAAVTTYIGNSWSHAAPAITEHDVHTERSKLTDVR
jgi:mono/diheme cytochrome c family protein